MHVRIRESDFDKLFPDHEILDILGDEIIQDDGKETVYAMPLATAIQFYQTLALTRLADTLVGVQKNLDSMDEAANKNHRDLLAALMRISEKQGVARLSADDLHSLKRK